ncbi:MAG TPA: hypothetical protein VG754_06075 [Verrucomicrobiae bacterium]|nr:hypothetical protein [Verrucomicrobiae bacterium]
MKNLFLCVTLAMFAMASSVLADSNTTAKAAADKSGDCCGSNNCCDSKGHCADKSKSSAKSACSKGMPSKSVLMSPKAAAAAGKS